MIPDNMIDKITMSTNDIEFVKIKIIDKLLNY